MTTYTIRRPTQNDSLGRPVYNPTSDPVVSSHRTLNAAIRALERQRRGSRRQGGYSNDYIVKGV